MHYSKIPIVSPGLMFAQKGFLLGLFSKGFVNGKNFAFQNGFGLSIKTVTVTVHGLIIGRISASVQCILASLFYYSAHRSYIKSQF